MKAAEATDPDEVARVHARAGLAELDGIFTRFMTLPDKPTAVRGVFLPSDFPTAR